MANRYLFSNGTHQKIKPQYVSVNGIARKIKTAYISVGGYTRLWYKDGSSLNDEKSLGQVSVGSVVFILEGGIYTPFYVAKHDYESDLNGKGRTLLVRRDCYVKCPFSSSDNIYTSSNVDTYASDTYIELLDDNTKMAVKATKIRYTSDINNDATDVLERSIFLLSLTELGQRDTYANIEGTMLDIANILQVAYYDGKASYQWTRTPDLIASNYVFCINSNGSANSVNCRGIQGFRPAFTLPATTRVDNNNLVFA